MSTLSQGTTVVSISASFALSHFLNELLKTYLPLQMSLHFPIFDVWIPASIMAQFKNFVPVVNFDLMNEFTPYTDFLEELSEPWDIQIER